MDACHVTEFSLVLTLLSYLDPPELHKNAEFRFPELHNTRIFHCDFFDYECPIHQQGLCFDWIVGNPPWNELSPSAERDRHATSWIDASNIADHLIARYRADEAFSWRVAELLGPDGHVGLLIHATSLTNELSEGYRRSFFTHHKVKHVTNFSNLAYILFPGRAQVPAAAIIYTNRRPEQEKEPIIHYGPFVVNQLPINTDGASRKLAWTITLYEGEIQTVDPDEAERGDGRTWKMALWGTYRDRRAVDRLHFLFPATLQALCSEKGWRLELGLELRHETDRQREEIEYEEKLIGMKLLDVTLLNRSKARFAIPSSTLVDLEASGCYIRKGRRVGLRIIEAPHVLLAHNYAAYSDWDFVVPNPKIGIAAPRADAEHLRALALVLSCSVFRYLMFFSSSSWGVMESKLLLSAAERLHVPILSEEQVTALAALHRELAEAEQNRIEMPAVSTWGDSRSAEELGADAQEQVDGGVERILHIPRKVGILAREFMSVRYQFNKGKSGKSASLPPTEDQLRAYAERLRGELDTFVGRYHRVSIEREPKVIVATIEMTRSGGPLEVTVGEVSSPSWSYVGIWTDLKQRRSQWAYVQRGLRIFDGVRVRILKPPRLVDWTQTQALLDADDIIAEVLSQEVAGDGSRRFAGFSMV